VKKGGNLNSFTKFLTTAVDFLFIKQPTRTSLGIVFGAATKYLISFLAVWFKVFQDILSANVSIWGYMLLGLAFVHLSTAVSLVRGERKYLSEDEEKAMSMIREFKAPDSEKQAMYRRLIDNVLAKVERGSMQAEIKPPPQQPS
jgi:hypothetical protein